MACLEHQCTVCGWWDADNEGRMHVCPVCGGRVVTTYDEAPTAGARRREAAEEDEYEPPDDEEDEEDETPDPDWDRVVPNEEDFDLGDEDDEDDG